MKLRTKILGSVMAAAALTLAAGSAGAVTVITNLGAISGVDPGVSLPFINLAKGNVYDFTFSLVPPLAADGVTSTQVQAQAQKGGGAQLISFDLFSGTPGAGTLIDVSPVALSSVLVESLAVGNYYFEISGTQIAKSGEAASGTVITSAVPEPATWAAMFLGFGAMGASMRSARRKRIALTA
jgi:hypothetical protein